MTTPTTQHLSYLFITTIAISSSLVTNYKSQKICPGVTPMATFSQTQYTNPSPKFHFVGVLQILIA
jgi:hypothetical protein